MKIFAQARNINPNRTVRVHPLVLSLSEAFQASSTNPDIGTVSENDERALESELYTSPSEMPLLEIHIPGQNGLSLLYNINGYTLMPVVGCRECMGFAPPDSSGEGNATQGNLAAASHAGTGDGMALVDGLKNDVQSLKSRCDMLEKTVNDLKSVCNVLQRSLETFRQHITSRDRDQGNLNTSYEGEVFELIPAIPQSLDNESI